MRARWVKPESFRDKKIGARGPNDMAGAEDGSD
jgi:hypothetical protein